ncbi:MAG TPA: hypothetical protein VGN26_13095 [Armatimonadota bacterium]|jgi:L-arabinose isomerase
MDRPRVGLLPLYLAYYDECLPTLREELSGFPEAVAEALRQEGLDVHVAPICCVRQEVAAAVSRFESAPVDALAALHLAYSPSLEAAEPLASTALPLLMLDTTPDASFGRDMDPNRLLYNHGIHGVQDLASVLRRMGKPYWVVAGHLSEGALARRARLVAQGAMAARLFRGTRALRIGPTFAGMGDFAVAEEVLTSRLGITVEEVGVEALAECAEAVTEEELRAEAKHDRRSYEVAVSEGVLDRSNRLGLGLRRYLERGGFGAFSLSFREFSASEGPLSTVPFLECSKAMARGVGYAGEGDLLTASLVGALQRAFGDTTFTEMFCPDWEGDSIFLSHMGEVNPEVAAQRPRLYEKEFPFTPAANPACLDCAPRPGPALLVNLSPGPNESFRLIWTPVEVLEDGTHPSIHEWVRAWIRPEVPVASFLESYSLLGGTHHCALMLGRPVEGVLAFARAAGLEARRAG